MTCTAHLTTRLSPADYLYHATMLQRFPLCDGACEAGRSSCQCSTHAPAEACTDVGTDDQPTHGLSRTAGRFPRAFNAALLVALLAILAFAQLLDAPEPTEPRDGIPPELLAEAQP